MTHLLQEVCKNYDKLLTNLSTIEDKEDLAKSRLVLIDRMITDLNIAIEDLNFSVLKQKVSLSEADKQDLEDMTIANATIKAFSPYIMWFNVYQKLAKEKNIEDSRLEDLQKDDDLYLKNEK